MVTWFSRISSTHTNLMYYTFYPLTLTSTHCRIKYSPLSCNNSVSVVRFLNLHLWGIMLFDSIYTLLNQFIYKSNSCLNLMLSSWMSVLRKLLRWASSIGVLKENYLRILISLFSGIAKIKVIKLYSIKWFNASFKMLSIPNIIRKVNLLLGKSHIKMLRNLIWTNFSH